AACPDCGSIGRASASLPSAITAAGSPAALSIRADVEAAPMLGPDGRPIAARGWYDSESIALDGAWVYIGIERVNRLLRFDFSKGFTRSRGELVPLPPAARRLPYNKGLEALVMVPKGLP